jgi:hypothetical protein
VSSPRFKIGDVVRLASDECSRFTVSRVRPSSTANGRFLVGVCWLDGVGQMKWCELDQDVLVGVQCAPSQPVKSDFRIRFDRPNVRETGEST